jgi:hypothetical protein
MMIDTEMRVHSVQRMMPVQGKGSWANPVLGLETLKIEAMSGGEASRLADNWQYSEKCRVWGAKPKWAGTGSGERGKV